MKNTLLFVSLAAFAVHSSPVATAQVADPNAKRGPLSVVGSLLTTPVDWSAVNSQGVPIAPQKTLLKSIGDQTLEPEDWPAPFGMPDYTLSAIFPGYSEYMEIDAVSSGNAFIPPTTAGLPDLSGNWASVTISVTNDAEGVPGNGWLDRRASGQYGRTTPGADLATHYLRPGIPGLINAGLVGRSFVTQLAEHQGLGEGDVDINSLDVAFATLAEHGGLSSRLLFKRTGDFFFSISPESASALNASSFTPFYDSTGTQSVSADPAAIYLCRHDGSSWGAPLEVISSSDLGLTEANANVDALDVAVADISNPDAEIARIVFSTQPYLGRSQLLVYDSDDLTGATFVAPLRTNNVEDQPVEVTGTFGLAEYTSEQDPGDDVDTICFFDPEAGEFDDYLATAYPSPGRRVAGLSVMQLANGEYVFQVTGLRTLVSGQTVTIPYIEVQYSTNPAVPNGSWHHLTGGYSVGSSNHFYSFLPSSLPAGTEEIFFRAVFRENPVSAEFAKTWASAMHL